MGTVNYYTSNYITLGIKLYDRLDLEKDSEFMEEIQESAKEDDISIDDVIEQYIADLYEDDYSNIEYELKKHQFNYFHVSIEPGYYEGFTINIENNHSIAFDDYEEKREAQKEITELKQFLVDCAGLGLVACYPGWCTGYQDYKGTLAAIREAIHEMREEVKKTPTWRQYEREAA